MLDEYTEEQTVEAFAGMRAEVLPYVRPAEAAEVRRSARRQHRTRIAAAAGAVVVVLAGVTAAAGLAGVHRSAPPAVPASPPPSDPALSAAELGALTAAADEAVEGGLTNAQRRALGLGTVAMSAIPGPVAQLYSGSYGFVDNTGRRGVYVMDIACAGHGTLYASFWGGSSLGRPPAGQEIPVRCSEPPVKVTVTLRVPWPGRAQVSVRADPGTIGHAAYADHIRMPNRDGS